MYDELIEELRQHHCDAKEDDTQEVCEECAYDVIIADKSAPSGIASVCVCGLMNRAADAIEELQKQLREEKVDNVNLTGWLAEEHARAEEAKWKNMKYMLAVANQPRWIPVTERLPECYLGAEVGNIEWISCGMVHAGCFGRGGKYRDAYFRTWTDAGEGMDAKDADYWRAVTLPEPPKEET